MKRFLLIACLPLIAAFTYKSSSNVNQYNAIALQIKNAIEENAFASADKSKVTNIEIWTSGDITIRFSTDSEVRRFNLFELYKTQEYSFGIQILENATFIRFHTSETEYVDINFKTHTKAIEAFDAFMELIFAGKDYYTPDIDLNIAQTRDSINILLSRYASFKPQIRVSLKGSVIITNTNMQFFTFNLQELESSEYSQHFEVNGIEMVPCTYRNVAAHNWIRFNTTSGSQAFIKFDCISDAELIKIHQLLVHLRASVMKVMNS